MVIVNKNVKEHKKMNSCYRLNTTQMDDVKMKYIYETDNDLSLVLNSINVEENPLSVCTLRRVHRYIENFVKNIYS